MIRTAVILAAGLGSRLGERTSSAPKAFLDFQGESLIIRSIRRMEKAGINKVFIGVGYLADFFKDLENTFPDISFIFFENEQYSSTGSMYTFYCGRHVIDKDFLLFESDLLYEPYALSSLMEDSRTDIVLASGFTSSRDEVWIEKDSKDFLIEMSKKKEDLSVVNGELVGITKLSIDAARTLFKLVEPLFENSPKMDYEAALVLLGKTRDVYVKVVEDLAWCEIDNEEHLKRAEKIVFPKILNNELIR
ncbi:MAG: phosphocholine cytidylyltransferase family protein [Spirochaetota bacterium]|nr:phosphocholine cytidylyltransferase family protein [Spirochaetota bacterium]